MVHCNCAALYIRRNRASNTDKILFYKSKRRSNCFRCISHESKLLDDLLCFQQNNKNKIIADLSRASLLYGKYKTLLY